MSDSTKKPAQQAYYSSGKALSTPPLMVRASRMFDSAVQFGALYLTTFFSFDCYAAAAASPFSNGIRETYRTGGGTSGRNPGSNNGGYGGGSGGQRLGGTVGVRYGDGSTMPAPIAPCGC